LDGGGLDFSFTWAVWGICSAVGAADSERNMAASRREGFEKKDADKGV
jgi:hypothetical protein